ncbi:hypothetical protein GCM10010387_66470 [Streptomyces inusitatus]|uniref:Uncharacterized protein n=1 Tax=Streptomyces inusitatus TaxID=68221 RepID=A0A918QR75_9ACTN|nr:hypothetical protein GCM10010387_66470 [Streptomyces inusitatus]
MAVLPPVAALPPAAAAAGVAAGVAAAPSDAAGAPAPGDALSARAARRPSGAVRRAAAATAALPTRDCAAADEPPPRAAGPPAGSPVGPPTASGVRVRAAATAELDTAVREDFPGIRASARLWGARTAGSGDFGRVPRALDDGIAGLPTPSCASRAERTAVSCENTPPGQHDSEGMTRPSSGRHPGITGVSH